MDAVGSASAVSQLAVYVHCAVRRLRHLYKTYKTATSLARGQIEDLHVLLKILDRIGKHHSPSDTELLVPVLISIADTAQTLWNWFNPSSILRLKWNLIAHQADIEEAFRLLRQKYSLLVFYYSERNSCALGRIESSLNAHCHAALGSSQSMSPTKIPDIPALEDEAQSEPLKDLVKIDSTHPLREDSPGFALNPASVQHSSGPGTNYPSAGMQPEQPPRHRAEGQLEKKYQSETKISIKNNKQWLANVSTLNHSYHRDRRFEGEYNSNDTFGGSFKGGNEDAKNGDAGNDEDAKNEDAGNEE